MEDHQRVVGTHTNTDNFHMHIQFNLVHPETFRMHTPYRDFQFLQSTAAMLEMKHGLQVVKGRGQDNERDNGKVRDKEANSWEQSFSGYLKEHRNDPDCG
nr:relaxase/mobilization nuclease domain-containing protein [Roseibium marinum]